MSAGELLFQAADGSMVAGDALLELSDDQIDAGQLYWSSDEDGIRALELSDDGQLVYADDEPEADVLAGLDVSELTESETDLLRVFVNAADDRDSGVAAFADYMDELTGLTDDDDELSDAEVTDWLRDHPDAVSSFSEFRNYLEHTDDLDEAYAMFRRAQDIIEEESAKTGGPQRYASFDEAFSAAKAAGEIGGTASRHQGATEQAAAQAVDLAARQARAHKVKPEDRTASDRAVLNARPVDTMAAAMDDFADELGAANDVRRGARQRIEVDRMLRAQESRGRG
jgi:hypothetical protein